ncbi:unannotated protein [freshwater metagenome]|uniref:Unannotated protein n=1 Tax=freshwater metagenome TaxID=449393 RepID=A0A6J7LHW7_9ZZZZ
MYRIGSRGFREHGVLGGKFRGDPAVYIFTTIKSHDDSKICATAFTYRCDDLDK